MKKTILLFALIFLLTGCSFVSNKSKGLSEQEIKSKLCVKNQSSGDITVVRKCGNYYRLDNIYIADSTYHMFNNYGKEVAECGGLWVIEKRKICNIKCENKDFCNTEQEQKCESNCCSRELFFGHCLTYSTEDSKSFDECMNTCMKNK